MNLRIWLGLSCALIHDPDLLILDESTTGADPLSRRRFWDLIGRIRAGRPAHERAGGHRVHGGGGALRLAGGDEREGGLACGAPRELLERTGADRLESADVALLPEAQRIGHAPVTAPPRAPGVRGEAAIEARDLTVRFGDFTAVDDVSFRIGRGGIFGFLGCWIGEACPTTHFPTVARGVFSKPLALTDLGLEFIGLAIAASLLVLPGATLLSKQQR